MLKTEYEELVKNEVYKNNKLSFYGKIFNKYINQSTASVYLIRKTQYYLSKKNPIKKIYGQYLRSKLIKNYGIQIGKDTIIGKGLHLPHPIAIVIGAKTIIGNNVSIYQNTTIGGRNIGDAKTGNQPYIGDNCILFSHSSVLGNVNVGKNCIVGAHSLLLNSTKDNETWMGIPAKKVKKDETS